MAAFSSAVPGGLVVRCGLSPATQLLILSVLASVVSGRRYIGGQMSAPPLQQVSCVAARAGQPPCVRDSFLARQGHAVACTTFQCQHMACTTLAPELPLYTGKRAAPRYARVRVVVKHVPHNVFLLRAKECGTRAFFSILSLPVNAFTCVGCTVYQLCVGCSALVAHAPCRGPRRSLC